LGEKNERRYERDIRGYNILFFLFFLLQKVQKFLNTYSPYGTLLVLKIYIREYFVVRKKKGEKETFCPLHPSLPKALSLSFPLHPSLSSLFTNILGGRLGLQCRRRCLCRRRPLANGKQRLISALEAKRKRAVEELWEEKARGGASNGLTWRGRGEKPARESCCPGEETCLCRRLGTGDLGTTGNEGPSSCWGEIVGAIHKAQRRPEEAPTLLQGKDRGEEKRHRQILLWPSPLLALVFLSLFDPLFSPLFGLQNISTDNFIFGSTLALGDRGIKKGRRKGILEEGPVWKIGRVAVAILDTYPP